MSEIPSILKKILQTKAEEVAERSSNLPLEEARAMAFDQPETRGFAARVEHLAADVELDPPADELEPLRFVLHHLCTTLCEQLAGEEADPPRQCLDLLVEAGELYEQLNDQFVEIQSGLSEGDRVVLNPAAIPDEAQEEEQTISPENKLSDLLR